MAHRRQPSTIDGRKDPHMVSLKVLRLSRPPPIDATDTDGRDTSPAAAVTASSHPSADLDDSAIRNPLSSLPSAFGSAYVGETFSCTVCARNEAPQADGASGGVVVVVVSDVSIVAEMQTPSVTVALELDPPTAEAETTRGRVLGPGQTVQKIASLNLPEPGNYTLVVTVTYTEKSSTGLESAAATERVRTFRKLYQFLAQQSLAVRTKTVELELPAEGGSATAMTQAAKYLLEAQLENVTQDRLTLETVDLLTRSPLKSKSLNWDVQPPATEIIPPPTLNPREVLQVAFLIESDRPTAVAPVSAGGAGEDDDHTPPGSASGRMTIGQLSLAWRTAMGERGVLSTGLLTFRKR